MTDKVYAVISEVVLEICKRESIPQVRVEKYGGDYLVHFSVGEENNRFFVRMPEYVLYSDKTKFINDLYQKSPWIKEMPSSLPRTYGVFKKRLKV